jgi:hypothetical protein
MTYEVGNSCLGLGQHSNAPSSESWVFTMFRLNSSTELDITEYRSYPGMLGSNPTKIKTNIVCTGCIILSGNGFKTAFNQSIKSN